MLHALAIALACSGIPLFLAVLYASDRRAARAADPERDDAETGPEPLPLAA